MREEIEGRERWLAELFYFSAGHIDLPCGVIIRGEGDNFEFVEFYNTGGTLAMYIEFKGDWLNEEEMAQCR